MSCPVISVRNSAANCVHYLRGRTLAASDGIAPRKDGWSRGSGHGNSGSSDPVRAGRVTPRPPDWQRSRGRWDGRGCYGIADTETGARLPAAFRDSSRAASGSSNSFRAPVRAPR